VCSGPGDRPNLTSKAMNVDCQDLSLEAIMARISGENFPVALRCLPREVRAHLHAIYGYARLVDNLGDAFKGDRTAALDHLDAALDDLFEGRASHGVFRRLLPFVARFNPPREPFDLLCEANRTDQRKHRYATWAELMDYCTLSADPVGYLVLVTFDAVTPQRLALSNAVCSGLQVLEHLQDVGEDAAAGRVYLPQEDMARFGVADADLLASATSTALAELVAFEAARAEKMLRVGAVLVSLLSGYARLAVGGFVAGGLAELAALRAGGYRVLPSPARASRWGVMARLSRLLVAPRTFRSSTETAARLKAGFSS